MIHACQTLPPLTTAVVYPTDRSSLGGAVLAAEARLIDPVLIGPGSVSAPWPLKWASTSRTIP